MRKRLEVINGELATRTLTEPLTYLRDRSPIAFRSVLDSASTEYGF